MLSRYPPDQMFGMNNNPPDIKRQFQHGSKREKHNYNIYAPTLIAFIPAGGGAEVVLFAGVGGVLPMSVLSSEDTELNCCNATPILICFIPAGDGVAVVVVADVLKVLVKPVFSSAEEYVGSLDVAVPPESIVFVVLLTTVSSFYWLHALPGYFPEPTELQSGGATEKKQVVSERSDGIFPALLQTRELIGCINYCSTSFTEHNKQLNCCNATPILICFIPAGDGVAVVVIADVLKVLVKPVFSSAEEYVGSLDVAVPPESIVFVVLLTKFLHL
nr:unnamed protein product [Callosobruchus analis]